MSKYIVQHRRGSTDQWSTSSVVLRDGEIGIEDCGSGRRGIIIGNGIDRYVDLPKIYFDEVITKRISITLSSSNWIGITTPYSQSIIIPNITAHSKIDLQPSPEQIEYLQNNKTSLMATNDDTNVSVFAFGKKPTQDMIIQATVTEVRNV